MSATVNNIQMLLFAVKTEKGIAYHYTPACKNYKLNEEGGKYKCATALTGGGEASCQLGSILNAALEREGVLYVPSAQGPKTE